MFEKEIYSEHDVKTVLTNPLYCLGSLHSDCVNSRELLSSEEDFIKTYNIPL